MINLFSKMHLTEQRKSDCVWSFSPTSHWGITACATFIRRERGKKKKARCEYNPGLFCSARQAGTTLCVISCHLIFTSLASLFCCSGRSPRQQFKRPVHEYIVYIVYPLRQNSTRTYVSYHPLTQDQSISSNIFHQWPTGTLVH
jgi:hypothetical protein